MWVQIGLGQISEGQFTTVELWRLVLSSRLWKGQNRPLFEDLGTPFMLFSEAQYIQTMQYGPFKVVMVWSYHVRFAMGHCVVRSSLYSWAVAGTLTCVWSHPMWLRGGWGPNGTGSKLAFPKRSVLQLCIADTCSHPVCACTQGWSSAYVSVCLSTVSKKDPGIG